MTSIQWILGILCILGIAFYIQGMQDKPSHLHESFIGVVSPIQGQLPKAKQASMIPRDSASATTGNPQLAKPDYRDWADARDSFQYFLEIYSHEAALASGKQGEIAGMLLEAPRYIQMIEAYILNPEAIPSRDLLERGFEARALADSMRRVGAADPVGVTLEQPACISFLSDNLMA